jgi:hypothetical protein
MDAIASDGVVVLNDDVRVTRVGLVPLALAPRRQPLAATSRCREGSPTCST